MEIDNNNRGGGVYLKNVTDVTIYKSLNRLHANQILMLVIEFNN